MRSFRAAPGPVPPRDGRPHACSHLGHLVTVGLDDGLPRVCWSWYHGLHLAGFPSCAIDMVVRSSEDEQAPPGVPCFAAPEGPDEPWVLDYLTRPVVEQMLAHEGFGRRPRTRMLRTLYECFIDHHMVSREPLDVELCLRSLAATIVLDRAIGRRFARSAAARPEPTIVEKMSRVVEAAASWAET